MRGQPTEDGSLPPAAAQSPGAAVEDVAALPRAGTRDAGEAAAAVLTSSGEQRQRNLAAATCPLNERPASGLNPDRSPPLSAPVVGLCANPDPEVDHSEAVSADSRGVTSTSVATNLLTQTLDAGERAGEPRLEGDEAHKFQTLGGGPDPGSNLESAVSCRAVPSLSRHASDVLAGGGSAQDHPARSRLLKLGRVPTPPFNTPTASSPSVVASAEQNLANIPTSEDALSEGLLNEDVVGGATANIECASEDFDRAVLAEAEEASNGSVRLPEEEEARRDGSVACTITQGAETHRDNVVSATDEGYDVLKLLADMMKERSEYYAHDAVRGILNTDPAEFSDDESHDVADDGLVAWKTVRGEHAGHATSSLTIDDETGQGQVAATEGNVDGRGIHVAPACTVLSHLVDEYAASSVTPTTPINVTDTNVNYPENYVTSAGGDCVTGKFDDAVTPDVDRVNPVSGEVTTHEPTPHGVGAAGALDSANLKRPFNQQNNPTLRFNAVSAGDAAGDAEKAPEMLGEKASSYAGPNLDSHSSLWSTLSSASTIAKLSGVVASKARGETHPTEPHKSPKRVRYDAHGRGAYIPVSDDEVEVAASADEIHDDESGGDHTREPEVSANGMLATVASIATASKETIVKALDILMPAGLPKIESETEVSNASEAGTTPQKAFTTEQVAAVPANLVNEPSADDTEATGCQGHNAGGVGFLNIVEDSIRSATGKIGGEVPSVVASDNSTQDIRVRGKAAVHPLAGTEPEPESSSSLRKRATAAAQTKASTEAAKDSSRAKKEGAARFEWCTGYTLAAAGSVLLVYVIVPLVVRAVTKA